MDDPGSVPRLPIDHFLQRLAFQIAPQVLDEQFRDGLVTLRMRPADMRQHEDALGGPEGVLGGQGLLAEHIEHVHHGYVNDRTPVLLQYLAKLCKVHGAEHPELFDITREFEACAGAMAMHMKKEELMLFPFIKRMELAQREGSPVPVPHFGTVENPVNMMKHEHEEEGERFQRIAALTDRYTPPSDGCNTYRAAYALLQEFEQDLHRHIHLENNILFPKAMELERTLQHASA